MRTSSIPGACVGHRFVWLDLPAGLAVHSSLVRVSFAYLVLALSLGACDFDSSGGVGPNAGDDASSPMIDASPDAPDAAPGTPDAMPGPDADTRQPVRINVNGPAHTGTDYPGNWASDPGAGGICSGSGFFDYNTASAINGTVDDVLFQYLSLGDPLNCAIGSLPAGDYEVNLYFAEVYVGCPSLGGGNRIFDIQLEGQTVATDVNIDSEAGCALQSNGGPVVKSFQLTISDGTLNVSMPASENVAFLSAIEVLPR